MGNTCSQSPIPVLQNWALGLCWPRHSLLDCFLPQLEAHIIYQGLCLAQPRHCSYDKALVGHCTRTAAIPVELKCQGLTSRVLVQLSVHRRLAGEAEVVQTHSLQHGHTSSDTEGLHEGSFKSKGYRSKMSEEKLHAPLY